MDRSGFQAASLSVRGPGTMAGITSMGTSTIISTTGTAIMEHFQRAARLRLNIGQNFTARRCMTFMVMKPRVTGRPA